MSLFGDDSDIYDDPFDVYDDSSMYDDPFDMCDDSGMYDDAFDMYDDAFDMYDHLDMYDPVPSNNISYDNITSKYVVNFDGKSIEIVVTDKAAIATQWIREIVAMYATKPMVVGLDVEWRPHPIRSMSNKSATLQLCIDTKCLILQLFYMDEIPPALNAFLLDSNFTFVGIEVGGDVLKLKNEYGLGCTKTADIREVAKRRYPGRYSRSGLKDLAIGICGVYMKKPKHVCLSNWESRVLDMNQVEYACIDAYASYKIGHKLIIEG